MNITINTAELRPTSLAALIADLMDNPGSDLQKVRILLNQLEDNVGQEESVDYLVDAGVTPEMIIEIWELVAE